MKKENLISMLIPLFTLLLGFIPHMMLSIFLNAFWISSPVDFPFMAVPTIFFGDLILLPLFNSIAFKAVWQSRQYIDGKFNWLLSASIAGVISILISTYVHYSWLQDSYTGFMDVERGKLSIAGWWHLSFTILEMTVVILMVILWFFSINKNSPSHIHRKYRNAWIVFIIFTLINIPDFMFRQLFIVEKAGFSLELITTQLPSFMTTFLSLLILAIASIYYSVNNKG